MARLFRSLRKTLTLIHQIHNHHQQQLCIHPSQIISSRTYIAEMRKEAFEAKISRLLRNEIQYELQSSPPSNPSEKRMFGSRRRLLRFFLQVKILPTTSLCNKSAQRSSFCSSAKNSNNKEIITSSSNKDIITDERYRQLENLDMMTAAKILFTDPPKKKKFGFDFHLVQFFFACMPSLAVYLVAQYARYEIRKMEAEVEQKKKQKEEEEAKEREKELELNPPDEKEAISDTQMSEVKERLDKLEETVKEIAVVTKKQSSSNIDTNQVTDDKKKPFNFSSPRDTSSSSASDKPVDIDRVGKDNSLKSKPELDGESKGLVATRNSSLQDPTDQNQSERAS